jgi:hypothetical protein
MRSLLAALLLGTCASVQAAPLYFAGETVGVGDPNPFYEHGTYWVFYLQNQGRHPWFMAQTADLKHWCPPRSRPSRWVKPACPITGPAAAAS